MAILKVFKNEKGNRVFFYINQDVRDLVGIEHGTTLYVKEATENRIVLTKKEIKDGDALNVSKTGKDRLRMTLTKRLQERMPLVKDDIFIVKKEKDSIILIRMISIEDCPKALK